MLQNDTKYAFGVMHSKVLSRLTQLQIPTAVVAFCDDGVGSPGTELEFAL